MKDSYLDIMSELFSCVKEEEEEKAMELICLLDKTIRISVAEGGFKDDMYTSDVLHTRRVHNS